MQYLQIGVLFSPRNLLKYYLSSRSSFLFLFDAFVRFLPTHNSCRVASLPYYLKILKTKKRLKNIEIILKTSFPSPRLSLVHSFLFFSFSFFNWNMFVVVPAACNWLLLYSHLHVLIILCSTTVSIRYTSQNVCNLLKRHG